MTLTFTKSKLKKAKKPFATRAGAAPVMAAPAPVAPVAISAFAPQAAPAAAPAAPAEEVVSGHQVLSPMVGTSMRLESRRRIC